MQKEAKEKMIVQIYEVQNSEEAKQLVEAGVDQIGILTGKGRHPRERSYHQANEIFESLAGKAKGVVLSLSDELAEIIDLIENVRFDILHLCAEKISPADVKKLKSKYPNLKIMKAIPVLNKESVETAKSYEGIADYLILDSHRPGSQDGIGATGETHDWSISREIIESVSMSCILAGGLGPENVAEAIEAVKPFGVDSKTKTDKPDGSGKDLEKVRQFVQIAKRYYR